MKTTTFTILAALTLLGQRHEASLGRTGKRLIHRGADPLDVGLGASKGRLVEILGQWRPVSIDKHLALWIALECFGGKLRRIFLIAADFLGALPMGVPRAHDQRFPCLIWSKVALAP